MHMNTMRVCGLLQLLKKLLPKISLETGAFPNVTRITAPNEQPVHKLGGNFQPTRISQASANSAVTFLRLTYKDIQKIACADLYSINRRRHECTCHLFKYVALQVQMLAVATCGVTHSQPGQSRRGPSSTFLYLHSFSGMRMISMRMLRMHVNACTTPMRSCMCAMMQ